MNYTVASLAELIGECQVVGTGFGEINYVITDSRQLVFPERTLFFALNGKQHNGAEFIPDLIKRGVRYFIVQSLPSYPIPEDVLYFVVKDAKRALQLLAESHRCKFTYPVIGITGSNGKTTIKEWLFQLLSDHYRIVRNPGSFNSQIGVPISVLQMGDRHDLGIFEAGISTTGEMGVLSQIIRCNIGIFLNLGAAHDAGFVNRQQKLEEKFKLFKSSEVIIYRDSIDGLHTLVKESGKLALNWGHINNGNENRYLTIIKLESLQGRKTGLSAICKGQDFYFELPFDQEIYIENAIHCIVLMLYLNLDTSYIQSRIQTLKPLPLRLELLSGVNNSLIINDAYSNDPESLVAALNFLEQHSGTKKRILILSDFKQSNQNLETTRSIISSFLERYEIDVFIGVGELWKDFQTIGIKRPLLFYAFNDSDSLEAQLFGLPISNSIILIKGARVYKLERLAEKLSVMRHKTRLEINLGHLAHNIRLFRSTLSHDTQLMLMLKAAAYGSGDVEMVEFFESQPIDYVAVAYIDEGVKLRNSGMNLPIMVLNPDMEDLSRMLEYDLEPEIYSLDQLGVLCVNYSDSHEELKCHIKLDTGMHRLGFESDDLEKLISLILENPFIKVQSVFSHLIASENPERDELSHIQVERFYRMHEVISSGLGYRPTRHILNSGGISRFADYQMEMVRLGIGMYGLGPSPRHEDQLLKVHTLKAVISQIKRVNKGQTVGYGGHFILDRDKRLATITIGYADGLMRKAGNGASSVLIDGHLAPTIGSICMDMTMIDITHLPNVKVGDEVEIFGSHLDIQNLSKTCDTISYEILSRISSRVKRIYVTDW
jgi:Alr-MurF fusion protein